MNDLTQPIELLSARRIADRLNHLAQEINQHYQGQEVLLVSILDGAIIFTADLLAYLKYLRNWIACAFQATAIQPLPNPLRVLPVV